MPETKQYRVVYTYKPDPKSSLVGTQRATMGPFEDRRSAEATIVQLAARAAVMEVWIEEVTPEPNELRYYLYENAAAYEQKYYCVAEFSEQADAITRAKSSQSPHAVVTTVELLGIAPFPQPRAGVVFDSLR